MKFTGFLAAILVATAIAAPAVHAQFSQGYSANGSSTLVDVGFTQLAEPISVAVKDPNGYSLVDGPVTEEQVEDIVRRYLAENKAAIAAPANDPAPKKTYPDMKMTGFFQLDTARFDQSANSHATLGDIQDGTGFRRARLAATGNLTEDTTYMFEFDIAQGQARFVDVWGQFNKTPFGNIRIGRYRQPFGMTELTSIRELPFIERPSMFALSPFRQTGIMLFDTALDQQMTWAVSGFRSLSDNFGNVYGDNGGYGTAERLTFLPVDRGDDFLVHLGADHSYMDPGRDLLQYASQNEIFISQNPNFPPGNLSSEPLTGVPPFVQTGVFPVDHVNLFNLEAAVSTGRSVLQSEVRWSNLSLPSGESVTIPAAYLTGRYMLTGEIIPYNRTNGVFGRVIPRCPVDLCKGHWGAWELASQVSYIDLNPLVGRAGIAAPGGVVPVPPAPLVAQPIGPGGRMANYTLGLNWYLSARAKIAADYIYTDLNRTGINSSTNTYAGMVQFDF